MKYQVIFIDVDNTILDFNKAEIYALQKTCEDVGYPYSEEVHKKYEYYNDKLWQLIEKGKIDIETLKIRRFKELAEELHIETSSEKMSQIYMEHLGEADFEIEGAFEMCQALSEKYKLAVMTNGITCVQKNRFKKSRLAQFISYYFISEEIGMSKPDPGIFEYALEKLDIRDKSKVLMIGDSLSSDMSGGVNAGIDTCFYNPYELETTVKVTYEVKSLSEIPALLSKLEED